MPAAAQCWAAIPAAGTGSRLGAGRPKQYLEIRGCSLIEHCLRPFLEHPDIRGVVVALAPGDSWWGQLPAAVRNAVRVVEGGPERLHSVRNCLRHLLSMGTAADWVLVHDAARPCLRREDVDLLLTRAGAHAVGGILAVPARDTMKRARSTGEVEVTVDRRNLWHALTPQMFRLGALEQAISRSIAAGTLVTDEAQAMELAGASGLLVQGHADNIKVTLADDLAIAELFLSRSEGKA